MMELWKEIQGFERYSVSTLGRVRNNENATIRKGTLNNGYWAVTFGVGTKKKKNFRVHRLMAQAFIPNPNNLPQVNHIDGIKTNNILSNLEWCTPSYNLIHANKMGNHNPKRGEESGVAILTEELVLQIKKELASGKSAYAIAKRLGIGQGSIYGIKYGKSWTWLE
jgi:hypothetical protein